MGSVVHTAPHPMGTGIRRPEREVTSYFHLVTRLRMMELHLHSPIRFDGVWRDIFPLHEYTFWKPSWDIKLTMWTTTMIMMMIIR